VLAGVPALLAAAALVSPSGLPAGVYPAPGPRARARGAVALPVELLALARKMEGLSLSSERFRVRTAISAPGAHVPRAELRFLQLFSIDIAGEATSSPPAASFTFTIFGHRLRLRVIGQTTYLFLPGIAKRDGGRPWVNLGRHGLGQLLGGDEGPPMSGGVGSSFKRDAALLAHAVSVQQLGPGTIDGQAISGFRMGLDEGAFDEGGSSMPAKPKSITERIGLAAAAQGPRSITLEMMIAPSGLPVQTRIEVASEGISVGALDDIYAANFPLTLRPPPRRRTIALARLRRLARRHHGTPRGAPEDALHT
jgi:hypothetical protein